MAANLAGNGKAVRSRTDPPPQAARNRLATSLRVRPARTSCVSFLTTGQPSGRALPGWTAANSAPFWSLPGSGRPPGTP